MCMAPKPPKLPPVPEVPDTFVAPMENPEDINTGTNGDLRKSKSRKGLRIDMAPGGATGSSGLSIPM